VWLKGEKAGKAETFVDLPGAPDNIRLGSDGHFWIALHVSLLATGIIHT
jgi:sugar lactone lactonase YvrE